MRLPSLSVKGRVGPLRERLAGSGVDALVVHRRVDVRWLTGFAGSAGVAVVTPDDVVLVTDARYGERAVDELRTASSDAVVRVASHEEQATVVAELLAGRRTGVDETALTWAEARELAAGPIGELVALPPLIPTLREVKDSAEIARMRAAAAIADAALAEVRPLLASRPTELDVARALDRAMQDLGATGPGYPTIVASGPNAALPHASPGDRIIGPGDLIVIDVGAEVDGYRSDMTRTFVVGRPDDDQQRWLDAVLDAQRAAIDVLAVGARGTDVHRAASDSLAGAGLDEAFIHGVGHGVGLVIHETPFLARSDAPLRAGQVVTVEPGVYLAGRGGVRWEDLLLLTPTGAESLTGAPKSPVV